MKNNKKLSILITSFLIICVIGVVTAFWTVNINLDIVDDRDQNVTVAIASGIDTSVNSSTLFDDDAVLLPWSLRHHSHLAEPDDVFQKTFTAEIVWLESGSTNLAPGWEGNLTTWIVPYDWNSAFTDLIDVWVTIEPYSSVPSVYQWLPNANTPLGVSNAKSLGLIELGASPLVVTFLFRLQEPTAEQFADIVGKTFNFDFYFRVVPLHNPLNVEQRLDRLGNELNALFNPGSTTLPQILSQSAITNLVERHSATLENINSTNTAFNQLLNLIDNNNYDLITNTIINNAQSATLDIEVELNGVARTFNITAAPWATTNNANGDWQVDVVAFVVDGITYLQLTINLDSDVTTVLFSLNNGILTALSTNLGDITDYEIIDNVIEITFDDVVVNVELPNAYFRHLFV